VKGKNSREEGVIEEASSIMKKRKEGMIVEASKKRGEGEEREIKSTYKNQPIPQPQQGRGFS
jgi:hypothetical protein